MEKTSVGQLAVWRHPAKNGTGQAWARALIVHGVCEHSWRHRNTIEYLSEHGVEVVRFDLRGHGESGGERQWIDHFHDYVADLTAVQRWIGSALPERPLFLLGHSLGGTIALYAAAEKPDGFRGILLSAPAFELGPGISRFKIAVAKFFNRVGPHLRFLNDTDLTAMSRDPEAAKSYEADPLCVSFNNVHQVVEILKALERVPEQCKKIMIPVQIIHGEKDRVIYPKGSARILEALASTDKVLDVIPGGYHELHTDLCKEEYFKLTVSWMKSRATVK